MEKRQTEKEANQRRIEKGEEVRRMISKSQEKTPYKVNLKNYQIN